ncbi:MAG: hypothetical protein ACREL7_17140 [Longimicrobiales bacterium]
MAVTAVALLALLRQSAGHAQDLRLELDSLRAPVSPAFVLLGVAPTAIERPSSLRAIAISAVSALRRTNGLIPEDYAIETAPYWMRSRPAITLEDLRTADPHETALHTLGISLATTRYEFDPDGDIPALRGTRIGAGVRFMLFDGTPSPAFDSLIDSLRALHSRCLVLPEPEDEACVEELGTQDIARAIQSEARDPGGFVLQVSAALTGDFPNDVFDAGQIHRAGVWITPGWRLRDREVELFGVARYLRDRVGGIGGEHADVFDAGGRVGWDRQRFALSAEAVQRTTRVAGESETRYRVTGMIEARLAESILASLTIGKGYEPAESDPAGRDRVVATLGIGFGAGARPAVAIPLAPAR